MRSPLEVASACEPVRTARAGIVVRQPYSVAHEAATPVELAIVAFVAAARLMRREGSQLREERLLEDGQHRHLEELAYRCAVHRQEGGS